MALAIAQFFALGVSRQVFQVVGGGGIVTNPWRYVALGASSESVQGQLVQPESNAVIFELVPGANPAPFAPFGDLVEFVDNPIGWELGVLPFTSFNVPAPGQRAIISSWAGFVAFPGQVAAVLQIVNEGQPDRYLFAYAAELALVKKKTP